MSEQYAPDEPASFDAIVERQPYEPATESADPFVGKDGLSDAASEVSRARETRETLRRFVRDPDDPSSPAPRDVTISAETASDALRENRNLEAQYEQSEIDRATAAAIDNFRGEQPAQPTEQPQPQFQQAAPEVQATEYAAEPDELDRLLNSVPDENTRRHIKQGLIQEYSRQQVQIEQARQAAVAHAEQARAAYEQQTASAILTAEAAALAPFPELQGIPREQVQAVLAHIARTNPNRHAEIRHHVANVKELAANQLQAAQFLHQQQVQAQNQQVQAQEQQRAQVAQQFRQYADYHDSRVAAVPPEVGHEVVAMAAEHGISKQQLLDLYETNPVIRHSAFQSMMADAAKFRLAQRATQKAQVRPVPSVQKPGVSDPSQREERSEYSSLERQYRGQSLSPRQAAELLIAKRAR
jgi:hypothetical protein